MQEAGCRSGAGAPRHGSASGRPIAGAWIAAALLLVAGSAAAQGKDEGRPRPAEDREAPEAPADSVDPERRAALLRLWARSYFPGRSGDIFLIPADGEIVTAPGVPFMHGSPWDYDARLPLILYGPGHVVAGARDDVASHQDIGATVETLLGLPRLATTTGRPLSEALAERAGAEPPRTIVVLVLDGFRPDYLERYVEETPTLRDLSERGARFPRARASALPTATAVSHTTLVTATDPALHGITGNTLYDRARREALSAFEGAASANVMALTLADRWSARTRGRAVIAAQGGAFYPAAALAGHGKCIFGGRPVTMAYFDSRTGGWNSNQDCYTLPGYLIDQNIQTLLVGAADEGEQEAQPSGASRLPDALPRFEADATVEILEMEAFGEDHVTDLLLVNHKAIDLIGHAHGPASEEMRRAVAEVDRQVARLVRTLDERVGAGEYVLVVTADHGMPEEPGEERRHVYAEIAAEVNARFDPEGSGILLHYDGADNQIYLDDARMEELAVEPAAVARFLEGLPVFFTAFTEEEVRRAVDASAGAPHPGAAEAPPPPPERP